MLASPRLSLRRYEPPPPADSPLVSIIVPARNEAANIERCITSLLACRYSSFEIIAVNDRSSDATGDILGRLAARADPRLRVVNGADLPEGWFGKSWACTQGARLARGTLLLFTDADTWHGPDLLGRAVGMLLTEHADLVTLLQRQEMPGFWVRVVQPHFFVAGAAIVAAKAHAHPLNELQSPDDAMANGQFILVRRAAYEAIGGHESVRDHVVEDILIAKRFAEAGKKRWIAVALDDMATRMYTSLSSIVEGWSKNLFAGAGLLTEPGSRLAYLFMALLSLVPFFWLLPSIGLLAGLLTGSPFLLAYGIAASLAAFVCFAGFLRLNREPAWYAVFVPLGALVQLYIFALTTWRGRRVHWKGRVYRHA